MKKYLICLIMLVINVFLLAEGAGQTHATNYSTEQMDVLAEQFKASTGFEGTIKYDLNKGVFGGLKGQLDNYIVTDEQSVRMTANSLLNILQPYFKIDPAQLSDWDISRTMAVKYQRVCGLEFEDKLRVVFIFHPYQPGRVSISSSFQQGLDFSKSDFITKEQAEEINTKNTGKANSKHIPSKLLICPIHKQGSSTPYMYRPCWRVIGDENSKHHMYYIDAITGVAVQDKDPVVLH